MKRDKTTNEKNENGNSQFSKQMLQAKKREKRRKKKDMIHVQIHENIKIEGVKANAPDQNVINLPENELTSAQKKFL